MTSRVTFVPLSLASPLMARLEDIPGHRDAHYTVHYTSSSPVLHLGENCPQLRNAHEIQTRTEHSYSTWVCTRCERRLTHNRVESDLQPIGHAAMVAALQTLEQMESTLETKDTDWFIRFVQLETHIERVLRVFNSHYDRDERSYPGLYFEIKSFVKDLHSQAYTLATPSQGERQRVWCAAMLANGRTRPAYSFHARDAEGKKHCAAPEGYLPLGRHDRLQPHYENWLQLVRETSLEQARTLTLATPWAEDLLFDRLPSTPDLPSAGYTSPQEWAQAEWEHQLRQSQHRLVDFWEKNAQEYLQGAGTREVLICVEGVTGDHPYELMEALRELGATFIADRRLAHVRVDPVVAAWLKTFSARRRGGRDPYVEVVTQEVTSDELEVAIGVYDPHSEGRLRYIREALQAGNKLMKS